MIPALSVKYLTLHPLGNITDGDNQITLSDIPKTGVVAYSLQPLSNPPWVLADGITSIGEVGSGADLEGEQYIGLKNLLAGQGQGITILPNLQRANTWVFDEVTRTMTLVSNLEQAYLHI